MVEINYAVKRTRRKLIVRGPSQLNSVYLINFHYPLIVRGPSQLNSVYLINFHYPLIVRGPSH